MIKEEKNNPDILKLKVSRVHPTIQFWYKAAKFVKTFFFSFVKDSLVVFRFLIQGWRTKNAKGKENSLRFKGCLKSQKKGEIRTIPPAYVRAESVFLDDG